MEGKKVSIIIPVYRGEKFIAKNLQAMQASFSKYFSNFELIVVVDGELDGSYREAKKVKNVKVFGYKKHQGKGFALKYGFKFCTGDYITFMDADMDLHPDLIRNFLPYMATADLVIGSKRHPFSKLEYPLLRRVLSRGFQMFTWVVLGLNLRDTQSGLKLIKKEVLEVILPLVIVKRYAFDVELCFLAHKHGFRIVEAPISVNYTFSGTGVNPNAVWGMFVDVLGIRYRYSFLHYYQKKFHRMRSP